MCKSSSQSVCMQWVFDKLVPFISELTGKLPKCCWTPLEYINSTFCFSLCVDLEPDHQDGVPGTV